MVFGLSVFDWVLLGYAAVLTFLLVASIPLFVGYPRLPRQAVLEDPPLVSGILPLRNQASTVRACLDSLLAQDYPRQEILVVEGGSDDGTREVLDTYRDRIRLIEEPPLPEGWVGKNWACKQGAEQARGDVLLFTDGDTVHGPGLLRRTVAYVLAEDLDLLTLYPHLLAESFWERTVLPFMIFLIGISHRGAWVNRPDKRWAVANGQYLLFPRASYEAIGGHDAVYDRVDEDYRLAMLVKKAGRRLCMADSRQRLRVRMYTSLAAIWQGFTKNAFPGLDFQVRRIALNTAGLFFGMLLPLLLLSAGLVLFLLQVPTLVLRVGVGLMDLIWMRVALAYAFMKVPVAYAFLAPVATVVVMGILIDSARRHLRKGGVPWKGRMYGMPLR
ncbi:MAG: glycosyltransferase [Candidatus Thermoplasmatota archaeon]|nr:glycosyltransferase [Candidatus Thermoplasmatota archaeon]